MGFREDIYEFAKEYMSITLRPHQLDWLEQIEQGGKRILLMAPRGHGKSTITVIYILFKICNDPDIKVLMASHVESLARIKATQVQHFLEIPKIQDTFGFSKGSPWSIFNFYLGGKIEPVMSTVAVRGGMLGKRFDIVVFDDLLSPENQMNEHSRDKIMDWIMNDVMPAIDPTDKEKVIVIGTRAHVKDWYGELLQNEMYSKVLDVATWTDEEGQHFLWPERFDREVLEMRLKEIGPRRFAQQYLNQVAPPEGQLLKREWIKYWYELPPKHTYKVAMGIDPSMGKTGDNASSLAIAVIAYDTRPEFHHVYVLELFKAKLTLLQQEHKILELDRKWRPVSINVESVLVNTTFSEKMIGLLGPKAQPIDYIHSRLKGTSEVSKTNRIQTLIGYYLEDGMISFRDPKTDDATRQFIETEYIEFPEGDKDLLDALNLAVDLVEVERMMEGPLIWTPSF